jgi:hypothetical protein
MYRVRSGVALALALAVIGNCAHAERLQPGNPLSGYQCYHIDAEALKLTPEDAWSGKGFPRCSKVRRRRVANWASRRAWSTSPGRYRSKMGSFRS